MLKQPFVRAAHGDAAVIAPEVLFAFLVNASGAIMLMVYAMVCVAQIKVRRRMEREQPERLAIRVWLFLGAIVGAMLAMPLHSFSGDAAVCKSGDGSGAARGLAPALER